MLEIGNTLAKLQLSPKDAGIAGIAASLGHNKLILRGGEDNGYINIGNANESESLGWISYSRWKVVALGMFWTSASTADDNVTLEFGTNIDNDRYGKMASAITGGEKFCLYDFQKYDPYNILCEETITEASGTMVITWTPGVKFGVWETTPLRLYVIEAAAAGMTSGYISPQMIIEIDTGGKW